ncbi:MAG: CoA-binding protein [Candidatus Jordarchaeales archaeon]|nr:CoA-binding protein [Candidatus Jordarchaeia archaeon]
MSYSGGFNALERMFNPNSIAVIGASENPFKMGYYCLKSLLNFKGKVYPVNPNHSVVQGLKAYPSILDVPGEVDLAVIVTPAEQVLGVVEECAEKGVKGVVVITAGFREVGGNGLRLQEEMVRVARRSGMRILGPNTFGFVNAHAGVNATFTDVLGELKAGNIAVVTQSGGVCHLFCYDAITQGLGVSLAVGLGNRCDIDFPEMIRYLARDEKTKVIALHIEGLDDPRGFLEAAKETVKVKPIVVYKVGRAKVDREAISHTGSMAGDYRLYDALFKQAGIISVGSVTELFDASKALSITKPPKGRKVALVSVQAGPAIIISDVCKSNGLELPEFTEETRKKIESLLPPMTIRSNPVDLAFAYNPKVGLEAVRLAIQDSNVDMLIMFQLYHPAVPSIAKMLVEVVRESGKPAIVALHAPRNFVKSEVEALEMGGIPVYPTPERAAKAAVYLAKYKQVLDRINKTA